MPPSFSRKEGAEMFTGWPAISSPHSGSSAHTSWLSLNDLNAFDIAHVLSGILIAQRRFSMTTQTAHNSRPDKQKERHGGIQPKSKRPNPAAVELRRKKIIRDILDGKNKQEAGNCSRFQRQRPQDHRCRKPSKTLVCKRTTRRDGKGWDSMTPSLLGSFVELVLGTKVISARWLSLLALIRSEGRRKNDGGFYRGARLCCEGQGD